MHKKYLIDGYNLMYSMEILPLASSAATLERAREQLLRLMAGSHGGEAPRVAVVFDATHAPPGVRPARSYRGLQVLFAAGYQVADDMIAELIDQHPRPGELSVVSNDRWIQKTARKSGSRPVTCEEYARLLWRLLRKHEEEPEIEPEKVQVLTAQERQFWLDKFGHLDADLKKLHPFDGEDFFGQ